MVQFWDRFNSGKLLADDTSLFSVVHDPAASSASLNDNLLKIYR